MPLTDWDAAAMMRLVGQLPKVAAIDNTAALKAERDRIERLKGPRNPVNMGMVAPLPPTPPPDSVTRKQFLENQKRPQYRPPPPTGA